MGLKFLHSFLEQHFPDAFYTFSSKNLQGKTFVVDGLHHIYSQLERMRKLGTEVFLQDGTNVTHIYALFGLLDYFFKNDVMPIFVFDGKQPDDKKHTGEKRKLSLDAQKSGLEILKQQCDEFVAKGLSSGIPIDEIQNQLESTTFFKKYKHVYESTIHVKHYHATDWMNILSLMGIPVIHPEFGEADPICTFIANRDPTVFGILSSDSDMLVYGDGRSKLIKKIENKNSYLVMETQNILAKISQKYKVNFTHENFLEFCVLAGTDFWNFKLTCGNVMLDELLDCYVMCGLSAKFFLRYFDYAKFDEIKSKYAGNYEMEYNLYGQYLGDNMWKTPNFAEVKKYIRNLNVCDNFYIENTVNKMQMYYMRKMFGKTGNVKIQQAIAMKNDDNVNKKQKVGKDQNA
jgi:5'-3' exonuclease